MPNYQLGETEVMGRIVELMPLKEGTTAKGRKWKRQDFIIETTEEYPRKIYMQAWNEVADLEVIKQGEGLIFSVDIKSREYNGNWYTDVHVNYVRPTRSL